jgi:hypothetical protein
VVRVSKAILEMEIEMPEKCFDCKMNFYAKCFPLNRKISDYKRRNDCPLKFVEESELTKYKAEAVKIPDICKYYDGWSCEAYQGDELKCPHICPNWEGLEE